MGDALKKAMENIAKRFGDDSYVNGNEKKQYERIPTGSLGLDIITGGGYPEGRFIEFYAPESAGKTTCAIHAMIEAQKKYPKKKVVILDFEHAIDRAYCEALGLNMGEVIISQPSNGDDGLEILDEFISSGEVSFALVDSIAAISPKSEIEGEMGDSKMGLHARLMSQACRKLTAKASKTGTVVYWTNQIRQKIGVFFGSDEAMPGGNAMKFYASIRVDLRKKQGDKDSEGEIMNSKVTAKTVKNKTAPPFQKCEFDIVFGEGIDRVSEVIFWGEKSGILHKTGHYFNYGDTKLANGAPKTKELLKDNPELTEEIEAKIRKHYKI